MAYKRPSAPSKKRPVLIAVGILAVLLVALYLLQPRNGGADPLEGYDVADVGRGPVEHTITAAGVVDPKEYVDVGAQVSGQIDVLHVEIGDLVEQGQLLAEVDPRVAQTQVDADRAQLAQLQARRRQQTAELELARTQNERSQRLLAADAISEAEALNSATNLASREASLAQLDAQIQGAQYTLQGDLTSLGYTKVYAPMDGMVVSITTLEGQMLNARQTAPTILRIADLSTMTVSVSVPEAQIWRIRPGAQAYFTTSSHDERRWDATVRQLLPQPEVVSDVVLYKVLLDVANPDLALLPQMTSEVTFMLGDVQNAVRVPVGALEVSDDLLSRYGEVQEDGDLRTVLVVGERGLETRRVRVGLIGDEYAEVIEGLEPGERVAAAQSEDDDDDFQGNFQGNFRFGG